MPQAAAEQAFGLAEQLCLGKIDLQQIGLEFFYHPFQRRGDLGDRQDAGHVGTALEGMQGALQLVADRLRQLLRTLGEERAQGVQMGFRLVAEDLQQLRVELLVLAVVVRGDRRFCRGTGQRLGGQGFRSGARLAPSQGIGADGQLVDVVALALRPGGELVAQLGHQGDHFTDQLDHRVAAGDAVVQHAVEQVLHRPGQLADDQRTDHAPAALQGMKGSAHLGERLAIVALGLPARQVFT